MQKVQKNVYYNIQKLITFSPAKQHSIDDIGGSVG